MLLSEEIPVRGGEENEYCSVLENIHKLPMEGVLSWTPNPTPLEFSFINLGFWDAPLPWNFQERKILIFKF